MPFYDLRTAGFQEYPTQIADQNGCCPELISGLSPSSRLPSKAAISRPTAIFSGGGEFMDSLVKIAIAIFVSALGGTAFAQSPPCMPGGSCCINGTCGTLEQFRRNMTIACLQADAIDNKSLATSIELAGRCTAARIMANRVEETQQENAKEHQRALDAQRQLREMGAPLPTQSLQLIGQAMEECRNKRLRGEFATYVASVLCSNEIMIGHSVRPGTSTWI